MKSDPNIRLNFQRITRISPSSLPIILFFYDNSPKEIFLHSLHNYFLLLLHVFNSPLHTFWFNYFNKICISVNWRMHIYLLFVVESSLFPFLD